MAQRSIGAARTGNFYSVAPFAGVVFSWLMFGVSVSPQFWAALGLALVGVWLTAADISE